MRWRGNLKDLSYERGLLKAAENLGASTFKRDLSIETTYSQTNLAGQSLERDCPARFVQLKVVSTDRSLFKIEAPRFSADFVHPLSSERPVNFPRHLVRALEINLIIATSDKNICSAVFN
jgi:hypothetical protein